MATDIQTKPRTVTIAYVAIAVGLMLSVVAGILYLFSGPK
jgi:hypothetical protein